MKALTSSKLSGHGLNVRETTSSWSFGKAFDVMFNCTGRYTLHFTNRHQWPCQASAARHLSLRALQGLVCQGVLCRGLLRSQLLKELSRMPKACAWGKYQAATRSRRLIQYPVGSWAGSQLALRLQEAEPNVAKDST